MTGVSDSGLSRLRIFAVHESAVIDNLTYASAYSAMILLIAKCNHSPGISPLSADLGCETFEVFAGDAAAAAAAVKNEVLNNYGMEGGGAGSRVRKMGRSVCGAVVS
jgi:hypothetical protein